MDGSNGSGKGQNVVAFDYLKTPGFQSLRADGAIGGITPTGRIHMAIYSERPAIPRRTIFEIDKTGQLGQLLETETRGSIVREMSADIFLDLRAAEAIRDWLGGQIEQLKKTGDDNDDSTR